MWANRLKLEDEKRGESAMPFVAVPAMMTGGAFQQQLYHWAFEQAKQTLEASQPAPVRDLFTVMN